MTELSDQTLDQLDPEVAVPAYDRSSLSVGIVHFGVGGFHRAHQAVYLDELMSRGLALDFALCGVGVLPQDRRMAEALAAQDHLYTVMLKHADGSREARVIGSMIDYLFAPDDPEAVIARMADPAVRIVSLTITEGGYSIDPATGEFDPSSPDIAADLAGSGLPHSAFGLIVAALRRRRDAGTPPFTVQSCDNIQSNGDVAKQAIGGFARLVDPELADWIESEVAFPNAMVDRITPVTTDADRAEIEERFGIVDRWPVVCEPFTQWVVEDHFPAGRPEWELVGAQLVDDVLPYELMKLRLLNASHQGLTYFGYLAGYRYAHEALADERIAELLRRYMDREATPSLDPVPGIDLDAYKAELIERFSNPEIRDTLARLCAESSDRIPKWLLPVVRHDLAAGVPVPLSAGVVASWARYAEGVDEEGQPIVIVDRLADSLQAIALSQRENPTAFIENRLLFGDLVDDPAFREPYLATLAVLHDGGAGAALDRLLAED
ncbi:mannitol dehydrogenase family protein [Amnibacterium flavum]|uniref:Mannitol-1-phosphate 5-dehydrogenase n=1 Tax=Amnibacterium flavum TaxID=2173173 RepID=A0A2V1HXV2_9MICO|nr:mannitol dehydrogenase family protein [Amnibacterium flavum]PVZ95194.1 mannitol dehydrogenase [Amnibacterium flavum]